MKLVYSSAAIKSLRKIPVNDAAGLRGALDVIAADPFGQHANAKKLTDHPGFRVRHGHWRAVYRVDRETEEIVVEKIGHRKEVYR